MRTLKIIFLALTVILSSCKKDENSINASALSDFREGIWVSNEGSFLQANAEVSVLEVEDTPVVEGFQAANGYELGDVLQSIFISDERAYLVLNNSQKVEVVNQQTMESIGVIAPCTYPRYFIQLNDQTGYISNGSSSGEVLVVNLESLEITAQIPVGNGPETMAIIGERLFVANSGGWAEDNSVSVIDVNTNQEIQRITVGDRPLKLLASSDGMLQVLCAGKVIYDADWNIIAHTAAGVYGINPSTLEAELKLSFDDESIHPTVMASGDSGSKLYIALGDEIQVFEIGNAGNHAFISSIAHHADAIWLDDVTSELWISQIVDYSTAGKVLKLNLEGTILQQFTVGIAPNGIYAGSRLH
jgi:YVTN family beta-propeller protein